MKCDELKPLVFSISDLSYVDEPIPQPNFQNPHDHAVYKATEVDALITKKDETIAELKAKLENVQASAYADSVDAGMENRRLKRALWIARAQRANEHYHRYHGKFLCPLEDIPEYVKWKQVERKCRAKEEEYK